MGLEDDNFNQDNIGQPAPEPTSEPAPEPAPELTPNPAEPIEPSAPSEPATKIADIPAPAPEPMPPLEPLSTPTATAPVSAEKPAHKSHKTLIIIIIIVLLILISGGIVLGLGAAGVINLGFIGSPTPSAKVAEAVCNKYGNTFSTESDDYVPESLKDKIVATYSCDVNSETTSTDGDRMMFMLYEFNEDVLKLSYFTDLLNDASIFPVVGVLENSSDYVKILNSRSNSSVSYSLLYKKFYGVVNATSIELAEDVIVELHFPDRNRTTTAKYEAEVNAINDYNKEIVDKVSTALLKYQSEHGTLPEIVPGANNNWQINIDGTGDTDFDKFYNTLGDLKRYDGSVFAIDALDPTKPNTNGYSYGNNIIVRYGYYCASYGDNSYAERAKTETVFTVTLSKANGNTICAGPVYSYSDETIEEDAIRPPESTEDEENEEKTEEEPAGE